MGYLVIDEETDKRMHFTRQPGISSWSMLVGFSAFGIGISYYGNDPFYMKMIYMVLAVLLGLSCLDDWEDCDFNKETEEVRIKKRSIWDIIANRPEEVVVVGIDDVIQTDISEEKVAFFGRTYQVVLRLSHGACVGLTESFTFGSSSEHQQIADKVHTFLNLDEKNAAYYNDNDSTDSEQDDDDIVEDDFERIDKSELLDECDESGSPLKTEDKQTEDSCGEKTE